MKVQQQVITARRSEPQAVSSNSEGERSSVAIDKITVEEHDRYFDEHKAEIIQQITQKKYKPEPVRRVYTPKALIQGVHDEETPCSTQSQGWMGYRSWRR